MVNEKPPKFSADIIDDVLRRVIEVAPSFSTAMASKVAQETRHEWAGEKSRICYIARHDEGIRSRRNESIMHDYRAGEQIALLERRYGLSGRRILQIVKGK